MKPLKGTVFSSRIALLVLVWTCQAATAAEVERGQVWASLSVAQQQALLPLKREWHLIDAPRKQKWVEVASRFAALTGEERERIQARMTEWAKMSPSERGRARLQFQETRQLTPSERQAKWQEYQALPDDQRRKLAQTAKTPIPTATTLASPVHVGAQALPATRRPSAKVDDPTSDPAKAARPAIPNLVQGKPGATTTTVSTRPSPPAHQQAGLPKIAATSDFVDPATLLPKRGPQAAATATANAASAAAEPEKTQ